ncbi:DNA-binding MarR family transcriptional regulator [Sphingobium sp. B7D2B]|uniref:MarR family winged helix-turn-helix transcriptional regulator n=1 Tax=Sphingobium sp. B7D2B TaxID=2940583 RepID=UPI0022249C7C|nr:MarR family transcriptional regulator [Sphingobium sp. B7D2B]MCW2367298.1 DNA-binding MarR family transcriptional regulator [Sphingobium sp. B7D2B]
MSEAAVERTEQLKERGFQLAGLEHTFGFLLHAAWRDASTTFNRFFAGTDMTPSAYSVLLLIHSNPGCAPGDLSEIMGITSNNMTRLLDDLVKRGFVAREVCEADRRVRLLRMTAAGTDFLAELRRCHDAYEAHFDARIGQERIAQLCELLRRFG